MKTQRNADKSNLEKKTDDTDKKIHDTSGLVKKQILILISLRLKVKNLILLT